MKNKKLKMTIMKKYTYLLLLMVFAGLSTACELDELQGPDAELYGSIIDEATGELVQQDIIRGGELELREHGWENVSPQFMNYKVDGTFRDSKLFSADYNIYPIKTNFHPIDTIVTNISGSKELELLVTPYIRIINPSISKSGNIITATFSLDQTGVNQVKKVGLYAGADGNVGEPMRLTKAEQEINAVSDPSTVYTLSINADNEIDLKTGKSYFFRIGALYDAPNARFNYAPAENIQL
ncbi:DUF3823 domain-containing protein [Robertkochia marina]|uniref:DUF3823 domain-containing protein n=1 Tax=Robertkochia marina TaxID=1227945 RepID=A0A4V3UY08_9FLAO|nr:DUF3823 domain-containing protein [Robertkochia marina]THD66814.1 DUF3823 domain-containing protein [Robertkochia marina]TRZ40881.1 DUF3823 domain-containing protein [Robertkochia marina]